MSFKHSSLALVVFLAVFGVYVSTSFPSVVGGDSGELLAESCQLGVAHPPGYPLFLLLNHFVMKFGQALAPEIPGSPAAAANVFSCFSGAVAAAFVSLTVNAWNEPLSHPEAASAGALLAALLFAFSPLTWEFSTGAEVFSLNNALLAAILFSVVKVRIHAIAPSVGWASMVAFSSGLALANQHASLLFVAPLAASVMIWLEPELSIRPFRTLACLSISAVLGLSPYCYLAYSAYTGPHPGSWGDLHSVAGFFRHVLRSEYGTFTMLTFGEKQNKQRNIVIESGWERIQIYFQDTVTQSAFAPSLAGTGLIIILFGMVLPLFSKKKQTKSALRASAPSKKSRSSKGSRETTAILQTPTTTQSGIHEVYLVFFFAFVTYVTVWHCVFSNLPLSSNPMARGVHSRFWMQPNMLLCIFAGNGFAAVMRLFLGLFQLSEHKRSGGPIKFSMAMGVAVSIISAHITRSYEVSNQRRDRHGWAMHSYGEAMLSVLPQGALLLSHTDLDWNTVRYLRSCEGRRKDLTHLSVQLLPYPWFDNQKVLYTNVTFPPMFPGVSTHKTDPGNARLIEEFILANFDRFGEQDNAQTEAAHGGSGIYLDLQAVDESQIGSRGAWRSLVLVPHGPVYRVFRQPVPPPEKVNEHAWTAHGLQLCAQWAGEASEKLSTMVAAWPHGPPPPGRFPAGSWEFAATSVFYDAHYQTALFSLTFALDLAEQASLDTLPSLFTALTDASVLLDTVIHHALDGYSSASGTAALSSGRRDVVKNAALAHVRLQGAASAAGKMLPEDELERLSPKAAVLARGERPGGNKEATKNALASVTLFLIEQPRDKDAPVFQDAKARYQTSLAVDGSTAETPPGATREVPKKKKKRKKKKTE